MSITHFLDLADQISDLSLGVHLDYQDLDRFTALETFEFEWPLQEKGPLASLKLSAIPLKVLKIVGRHQRLPTRLERYF
jgi:hypothetical protein